MKCVEARARLQQRHDEGLPAEGDLRGHLAGCPSCAAFARFLDGLAADLRGALDAEASALPAPDLDAVVARAEASAAEARDRRRFTGHRLRIVAAAAAALLVAGLAGLPAWLALRDRARVAAQVSGLVEGLFAEPLLADAADAGASAGTGLRAWLSGTGSSWLP